MTRQLRSFSQRQIGLVLNPKTAVGFSGVRLLDDFPATVIHHEPLRLRADLPDQSHRQTEIIGIAREI
jgi:hypothetical protein